MRASCESSGHQARQGFDGREQFGRERFSGVSASVRQQPGQELLTSPRKVGCARFARRRRL
jgi:hypothetical protein